ncbi:alginate lyase family protein [Vibrio sp. SCSIO 43140]|uniref:alginate lyase family protein n=1 Tax=Vibrio sp. SCSIO 43140 TaxID=2819100 RepID=UPI0020765307|nr:alginate lyase family protein [Vibrio sp. SCSIO 43140]USD63152.1 alginate lyase family protein [Vibrio sp. SCSIO 43140]
MIFRKAFLVASIALSFGSVAGEINFISYDESAMEYNKQHLYIKKNSFEMLVQKANKALEADIDPVTNKTLLPASGDKHDYFSFGPYWWPNPDTKDGLPYVRRDGEYNMATKSAATDKHRFIRFAKDVTDLGLAYYFTDDKAYADKAVAQLNAWFVDPTTRMNPNLNHAQAIPGIVDGRGIGIIDSRLLIPVLDSINILKDEIEPSQYEAIVAWFSDFNDWLLTSNHGFEEDNWHNNHGTWYDAQVAAFAIFVGDDDIAKKRLRITQMRRIGSQFDMNGRQHGELERTRPWHYSNFNLEAYNHLGHFGDKLGVDVWLYEVDKHSLKKGYEYIAQHANKPTEWKYKELKGFDGSKAYVNLLYAQKAYGSPLFTDALSELGKEKVNSKKVANLLFK